MDPDFELNEKRIIEEFHHRRQLGIREPTVSEERVRKFLTKIGKEIHAPAISTKTSWISYFDRPRTE